MASIRCTVALLPDKNRKVDIKVWKEGTDKFLWQVIEGTGGSLRMSATSGDWFNTDWSNILTFYQSGKLALVAYNVKFDFLDQVASGKTITTDDATLFNNNPAEEKVSCKLERMN
jgi:hypothetical protein